MKKYIILAAIVLFILVAAVLILNRNTGTKTIPNALKIESYQAAPAQVATIPSPIPDEEIIPVRVLTARENESIEVMRKLVEETYLVQPDFELGYSSVLHKFILRRKNGSTATSFEKYLELHGAQSLLSTPPSYKLIIYTDDPLSTAITQLEEAYREQMLNNANRRYEEKSTGQSGGF